MMGVSNEGVGCEAACQADDRFHFNDRLHDNMFEDGSNKAQL